MYANISKQANRETSIKLDKYIHIAIRTLLTTRIGAKEPCFQNGLRLEVFGYLLCHRLCIHCLTAVEYRCKYTQLFSKHKQKTIKVKENGAKDLLYRVPYCDS